MRLKITVKKSELLFFIAFATWLLYQLLESNIFFSQMFISKPIYRTMYVVVYSCLLLMIVKDILYMSSGISIKKSLGLLFCIGVTGISTYLTESYTFLLSLIMFIFCARKINFYRILKVDLFFQIVVMVGTILACQLGLIENGVRYRDSVARYFLGYKSTLAPIFFSYMVLMYVYLRKTKMKVYEYIILLIINYYLYQQSNVRASFYVTIMVLLTGLILRFKNIPKNNNVIRRMAVAFVPLVCVISIMLQINYNSSNLLMRSLDMLLSSRLRLGKEAYDMYGISLFGQVINWNYIGVTGAEYSYVDSAFMKYTIMYGVLFMVLVVVGMAVLVNRAWKQGDGYLCLIIFILAFNAISNPQLLYLQYNPFILLLGMFLVKGKRQYLLPEYSGD